MRITKIKVIIKKIETFFENFEFSVTIWLTEIKTADSWKSYKNLQKLKFKMKI